MRILLFLIIFIYCSLALGNSYPSLISVDEILENPYLARLYYQKLKDRFSNNNFDAPSRFSADISRLSEDDYQYVIDTLKKFFQRFPDELERIHEEVHVSPFSLDSQSSTVLPAREDIKKWEGIGNHFFQVSDEMLSLEFLNDFSEKDRNLMQNDLQKQLNLPADQLRITFSLSNKKHQEALINVLSKQFNRKNDQRIKRALADVMFAIAAGPIRMERIQDPVISAYQKYYTFEDIENTALKLAKEYNLPGMIVKDLRGHSSFKNIPKSKIFKKGTLVMPMTRGEAIFKGIGPGECVSTSCYRYLDAFFNDSMHFKVLKDGKEIGYVGVYKVKDEVTGAKYWFIETIQSPYLVNDKSGNKKVRELVKQLQQLAIRDHSLVVIPSSSYNSYNYKEVVHAFSQTPELVTGHSIGVNYRNLRQVETFRNFSTNDFGYNDIVANNSGYQAENLINGIEGEFNNRVVALSNPLIDQPDWYWKAYDEAMTIGRVSKIDLHFKLTPLKRADLILQYSSGLQGKRTIEEMIEVANKNGDQSLAKNLRSRLYKVIPATQQGKGVKEQLKYAQSRVKKEKMTNENLYQLKNELALKAKSWDDYLRILDLGDGKEKSSLRFLLESMGEFTSKGDFDQVMKLAKKYFSHFSNDQSRIEIFKKLAERANTPEQFIDLLHFDRNLSTELKIPNELKQEVLFSHWGDMYVKFSTTEGKEHFLQASLHRQDDSMKMAQFDFLVKESKTIEELENILKIFPFGKMDADKSSAISNALVDRISELIKEIDLNELTTGKLNFVPLQSYINGDEMEKIRVAFADKIRTLDDFKKLYTQKKIDERTYHYISQRESANFEVRAYVKQLMQKKRYVNLLLNANNPLPMDENVGYSDHAKLYEDLYMSEKDNLNISKLSKIDRHIMSLEGAHSLSLYLDTIHSYPIDFQKRFFEAVLESDRYLYEKSLGYHRELARKMSNWASHLQRNGVANAQELIANQFFSEETGMESKRMAKFENCIIR